MIPDLHDKLSQNPFLLFPPFLLSSFALFTVSPTQYTLNMTDYIRPDLSILAILGYAFFAFLVGVCATPWFISFLRKNKLGKQLRVEAVDGRDASVFRQYHKHKFGTPTMGGLLIWGSILMTILFSRLLSLFGVVENSLMQRGEVYLPLFVLITLGYLGAIDDYLNVIQSDKEHLKATSAKIRKFAVLNVLGIILLAFLYSWNDLGHFGEAVQYFVFHKQIRFLLAAALIGCVLLLTGKFDGLLLNTLVGDAKKAGLSVRPKLFSLLLIGVLGAYWFVVKLGINQIDIPFYGSYALPMIGSELPIPFLGPLIHHLPYVLVFLFILVGTANAVNVTDGLDGLAGGLLIIAYSSFALIAYQSGYTMLAGFCAIVVGATAAFLWHNVPPALFFMGDTGSIALGGTLGVIALMTDTVLVLPFVGFIFVIEMLSVIIQLTSKKYRGGKKVFRAAPIHHHFEALEWGESKVTMRFWIIGGFMAFVGVLVALLG